jgi:hypothetical protein
MISSILAMASLAFICISFDDDSLYADSLWIARAILLCVINSLGCGAPPLVIQ